MLNFRTQVLIPNRQRKVSAFFRVLAPAFLLTLTVAFFRVYYAMNGYSAPMLINILLILCLLILPIVWWQLWYQGVVQDTGDIELNKDAISVSWYNPAVTKTFPIRELKDLAIIYDGYGGTLATPATGNDNLIKFVHNGTNYNFNFRLASEEAAGEMAKVLKTWYQQGLRFADLNSQGEERYLMIYSGEHKQALA